MIHQKNNTLFKLKLKKLIPKITELKRLAFVYWVSIKIIHDDKNLDKDRLIKTSIDNLNQFNKSFLNLNANLKKELKNYLLEEESKIIAGLILEISGIKYTYIFKCESNKESFPEISKKIRLLSNKILIN